MKLLALGVVGLVGVLGCEKGTGGNAQTTRVEMSPDEAAMLAHLPAKNVALMGGNLARFQKFLSDPSLSRVFGSLMPSAGPGTMEWQTCYAEAKNVKMLGALKFGAGHVDLASVVSGMELTHLEACAKRAGFPATVDADHKYIGIDLPSPQGPMKLAYLALPDGMLYTRTSMQFPVISITSVDRGALEQDIASIATAGSAATDKVLVDQIGDLDRSRASWFVGNGEGTPIAGKVGNALGTIDFGDGIAFDITVQVIDKALADQIADGIPAAKQQAGKLGGAVKVVADKLAFNRSGDRLRFRLAIDYAQLKALFDQLAPYAHGQAGSAER